MTHSSPFSPRTLGALASLLLSVSVSAGDGFTDTGPAATLGGASTGQSLLSNGPNPAAIGFDRSRLKSDVRVLGGLHVAAGIEYGSVEELFDLYDQLSSAFKESDGGGSGGIAIGSGIDVNNPDLDALIAQVESEATRVAALLTVVGKEGYANADAASDVPFIINAEVLGGTLGFDINYSGSASAKSVVAALNFDPALAKTQLEAAYNLAPGDPSTTFDLSGGIALTIDPNTGFVVGSFDNDSLMAIRAAKVTALGVTYSYPMTFDNHSTLYLGTRAKYVRMGLARLTPRIGDITDSQQLFEDIRDAKYVNTARFGLDLGALWVGEHVTLGASAKDIFEPTYEFNAIDTSAFSNPALIKVIEDMQTYQQEAQVAVEASLYTTDRTWAVSSTYETNAISDALGEEHQWLGVSAGWHSDNFWLPNVRVGYRSNQTGSKINLYTLGFTFFRYINLDIAAAPKNITIEGTTLPQRLSGSLGFNFVF